ncbi:uncharacterized protein LOC124255494 isoform X2 [Haliotis rubra]|uniref:uncharacterized protein LOC124255494 isoform X2 n=1 Tax=Haliotis rubra TaxID=36100 RepID=UPI001EE5FB7D|nr:uncharacterized protein LOC124255494 isoform X2 [Haliotis rubra]
MCRLTLWAVLVWTVFKAVCADDVPCPGGVAELNTEYSLTSDRRNYTGWAWVQPGDERHVATCNQSCSAEAGYSATMNATHTTLTIDSVGRNQSGTWTILDTGSNSSVASEVCHLVTAELPQCNISSDADTDALELGRKVTLSVETRGYFCSGGAGLDLTTGNITEVLLQNLTGNLTDAVANTTFNISSDRLGEVKVTYQCDRRTWMLGCGGVQRLKAATSSTVGTSTDASTTTAETPTSTGTPLTDGTCTGGMSLLGEVYHIVNGRSNYTGFAWVRPDDRYVVTCNPSCSPVAGYRATINVTHSTLTIAGIGIIDVGTWKIVDATVVGAVPVDVCQLTAAGRPRCSISSEEDTDSLEPGTQLTLTVDITDYYCSVETGFDLTTGAVTDELVKTHNVSAVSSQTVNKTFNIDVRRLGDVKLNFQCDRSRTLTCTGVQRLMKSPPQCNISSDVNTNALQLGSNLTLTLGLRNYYCHRHSGSDITTGSITDVLMQNQTTSNITDTDLATSFVVTSDHLGNVSVTFTCDTTTKTLECGGVDRLTEATSTTTLPTSSEESTLTSEEPMTSEDPPATASSPLPKDTGQSEKLTVGLSVGVSLCVLLVVVIVALKIYNERFTKEKRRMRDEVGLKSMKIIAENERL